jgi:hypothetical protein
MINIVIAAKSAQRFEFKSKTGNANFHLKDTITANSSDE